MPAAWDISNMLDLANSVLGYMEHAMKPSGRVEVAFPAVFYSFSTADWSGWRYNVCASQLLLCQPQTGEVFL